jgi:hypothetical protein
MNEPDLTMDVEALFDHLVNHLQHDLSDRLDWSFTLRSPHLDRLETVAEQLSEDFFVHVQDEVENFDADGEATSGDPMLTVYCQDALTQSQVQEIADRLTALAAEYDLVYEGVACYDPIDDDDLPGWLSPVDAALRLRSLVDGGFDVDAEIPWAFLIIFNSPDALKTTAERLNETGLNDIDIYDEQDDEGSYALCVFVAGSANECALTELAEKIEAITLQNPGELIGIQFCTREELNDSGDDE